jgi:hypothetical protein
MVRKAEIELAWSKHDESPETFGCEEDKSWQKEKMVHSRYNMVCRKTVEAYAIAHPKLRIITEQPKPELDKCSKCHKKRAVDKMCYETKVVKNKDTKLDEEVQIPICARCYDKREKREEQRQKQAEVEQERLQKKLAEEEQKKVAKKLAAEIIKEQKAEIVAETTKPSCFGTSTVMSPTACKHELCPHLKGCEELQYKKDAHETIAPKKEPKPS